MSNHSRPRRIVTRSGGILRGVFASTKYYKSINWEGDIEKDVVILFEFSHRIVDVVSQPFKVTFMNEDKQTSRTPDFLVQTIEEKIIVECKSKRSLEDPKVAAHMEIGRKYFEKEGYRYFIATNELLRSGYALANGRFLLPYRIRPMQHQDETARILDQLKSLKNKLSEPNFSSASSYFNSEIDVLVMMASGFLFFNYQVEIQDQTELFFSQQMEDHDAASFLFS